MEKRYIGIDLHRPLSKIYLGYYPEANRAPWPGSSHDGNFIGSDVDVDASNWPLQREVINLLGTTRNRVPNIGTGENIFGLGGGQVTSPHDTTYTAVLSAQKIWGKPTFKMGYEHRRDYSVLTSGGNFGLATDRCVTSQYYDNPVTAMPLADFLLGFPSSTAAPWGIGS